MPEPQMALLCGKVNGRHVHIPAKVVRKPGLQLPLLCLNKRAMLKKGRLCARRLSHDVKQKVCG
jgi:hypothetical protein